MLAKIVYGINYPEVFSEGLKRSWENLSNPSEHNPNDFMYLTHGLHMRSGSLRKLQMIRDSGYFHQDYDIDLTANPMRISQKPLISAALINQHHLTTFTYGGLILSIPFDNILGTYPQDIASNSSEISEYRQDRNICYPKEILANTKPKEVNEIILEGTTQSGKVEVQGFFVKTFDDGSLIDLEIGERMSMWARYHELPLVAMEAKASPIPDQPLKCYFNTSSQINSLFFHQKGLRYFIDLNDNTFLVFTPYSLAYTLQDTEYEYVREVVRNELPNIGLKLNIANFLQDLDAKFKFFTSNGINILDPNIRQNRPARII